MVDRAQFLRQLERTAESRAAYPAILAGGEALTYADLWQSARAVAASLTSHCVQPGDRVALLGERTAHDFIHMIGIWLAGAAYVPLNRKFPLERNRRILLASGARGLLATPDVLDLVRDLVPGVAPAEIGSGGVFASTGQVDDEATCDLAYLIFTSGTTGTPKGVPITFANLAAYLTNLNSQYPLHATDRVSQLADLSFDASVHEFALAWWTGAALCPVPAASALMWPRYAREHAITSMLLVPSSVVLASRARLLAPGALPDLRLVFLGAEAVTKDVVRTMQLAAPHAQFVNLWGPTESTVFFTHFAIDTTRDQPAVVPIGRPLAGQEVQLYDGEILQAGSQVMHRYWRNPQADAQRFVELDGRRWYRSGDLARWDEADGLNFLGRADRQVKIRGWRIELLECETAIREASGCDQVAVVPLRREGEELAYALACFLAGLPVQVDVMQEKLKSLVPEYMIPARFELLDSLPLNASGKTDYFALEAMLKART